MIRGIIFDCFGVLVSESWLPFKDEFFGNDPALAAEATNLMEQANAGYLTQDEFMESVAKLAKLDTKTVRDYLDKNSPNVVLFRYIEQELKPHHKIGMLSNAAADWLDDLFTPEQLQLFDATVLSFEAGISKPDKRAYEHIAEKLGLQPEECAFVDDQPRHCNGAAAAGMHSFLYENVPQLQEDLGQLLNK